MATELRAEVLMTTRHEWYWRVFDVNGSIGSIVFGFARTQEQAMDAASEAIRKEQERANQG